MKKIMVAIMAFIISLSLAACGGGSSDSLGDPEQQLSDDEYMEIDVGDEVPGNILRRQDENELVTVFIEKGTAEVMLDSERWKELFNIEENLGPEEAYIIDFIQDGPFPVEGVSGWINDAIIGYVEGLDQHNLPFMEVPTIALLMEDGTVEYFPANPFIADGPGAYESYGKLPWLNGIVSLSYDLEVDGYGAYTIYAENSAGDRFNIQYVTGLTNVFDGMWECFIPDEWGGEYYCSISFSEDMKAEFNAGRKYEDEDIHDINENYSGTYDVFLNPLGDDVDYAMMNFDLFLDWWIAELGEDADADDLAYWEERQNLVGAYRFRYDNDDGCLKLYLDTGDALMNTGWRGEPIGQYSFSQTYTFG